LERQALDLRYAMTLSAMTMASIDTTESTMLADNAVTRIEVIAIGYILFVGFVHIYRRLSHNWEIAAHPILRYIAERPQTDQ